MTLFGAADEAYSISILTGIVGLFGGAVTAWIALSKNRRDERTEALRQSNQQNDRLIQQLDHNREELNQVYASKAQLEQRLATKAGRIQYLEDRFQVPAEERWEEISKLVPHVPIVLVPQAAKQVGAVAPAQPPLDTDPCFARNTNEQREVLLREESEKLKKLEVPGSKPSPPIN